MQNGFLPPDPASPVMTATKAVQFSRLGNPADVVEIVEIEQPPLGPGDARIDVEAAPINPSHLMTLRGLYGVQPQLPAIPGAEGVGTVVETGAAVTNVRVGDRVMLPPYSGAWQQQVTVPAERIAVIYPPGGDPVQLSMLMANPPTALLLLSTYGDLAHGDWVIQNAANSAVGQYLMRLAKIRGIRTVNVMRRSGLEGLVAECGGDICLVDGDDLAERVRDAADGAAIRVGIDCVAGRATGRIAACLAEGGTVVNYGRLSEEPCIIPADETIFRNIALRGIWLTRWLTKESSPADRKAVYDELARYIVDGTLSAHVEATYPLDRIKEAVTHAGRGSRTGKVVILPNG
jgi:NADPH:quinone reductase-like Zn-dependent oxidoreductase